MPFLLQQHKVMNECKVCEIIKENESKGLQHCLSAERKSAHLFIGSMSTRGKIHSMTTLCAEVGLLVRNMIESNNNVVIKQ